MEAASAPSQVAAGDQTGRWLAVQRGSCAAGAAHLARSRAGADADRAVARLTDWQPTERRTLVSRPSSSGSGTSTTSGTTTASSARCCAPSSWWRLRGGRAGAALALALLFLDDWPWRKIAVSVIILPMMIIPVDAANAFFMLFNEHGPINHVVSLLLGRPVRLLLAVPSDLGDGADHAGRDLAVDAADVPAGAHRLYEPAAQPDPRRHCSAPRRRASSSGSCCRCCAR